MILEDYLRWQKQLEAKQKQLHQSEGASKQLLLQLKEEFAMNSVDEAIETLGKWQQELAELEKSLAEELAKFVQEHGENMEEA